jgi:hypothetical protein
MKSMKSKLIHAKNPDLRGGYWDEPIDPKNTTAEITSLKEARKVYRDWIIKNGLGGGNLTMKSGQVTENDKVIARVSFNGRVWDNEGKEIIID